LSKNEYQGKEAINYVKKNIPQPVGLKEQKNGQRPFFLVKTHTLSHQPIGLKELFICCRLSACHP
jgi:hypothetical protein